VVAIVADRIEQPDARKGFILDGFPRTVPQAEALDRMLAQKGLKLDGVIELKVNPEILVKRIENRVAQMQARGETVRPDDNPDILKQRLAAYQAQTAPLVAHYRGKGTLRSVDGMASVDQVTGAIAQALAGGAPRAARKRAVRASRGATRRKAGTRKRAAPKAKRGKAKAGRSGASRIRRNSRKNAHRKGRARRLTKRG
jgi:adenylate kinase